MDECVKAMLLVMRLVCQRQQAASYQVVSGKLMDHCPTCIPCRHEMVVWRMLVEGPLRGKTIPEGTFLALDRRLLRGVDAPEFNRRLQGAFEAEPVSSS